MPIPELGKIGYVLFVIALGAVVLSVQCRESDHSSKAGTSVADLAQLKKRGQLRILSPSSDPKDSLPRAEFPLAFQRTLAEDFCRQLGLKPVIEYEDAHDQLLEALVQGKTDLVVANLTIIRIDGGRQSHPGYRTYLSQ